MADSNCLPSFSIMASLLLNVTVAPLFVSLDTDNKLVLNDGTYFVSFKVIVPCSPLSLVLPSLSIDNLLLSATVTVDGVVRC